MRLTTITLTRRNAITVATLTLAARAATARRLRQMERQAERRQTPPLALPGQQQGATQTTRAAAQPLLSLHSREAWRRGRALAERELPDLEARLRSEILCTPEDREALTPAILMRARGELWVAGYAALLWRRLVAAEPVEAYYSAGSGRANVWDGTLNQRLDARAWNLVSSDLWAAWADAGESAATEREA